MKMLIFVSLLVGLTACVPSASLLNSLNGSDQDHYRRGSYRGSYYIVSEGDTLYYVAYITDRDISDIIDANMLVDPDKIYPGQKLNLWHKKYVSPAYGSKQVARLDQSDSSSENNDTSKIENPNQGDLESKNGDKTTSDRNEFEYSETKAYSSKLAKGKQDVSNINPESESFAKEITWQWPTNGRLISKFSSAELGNKGIDIQGKRGQPVVASAKGKIVYAGSALRGYGNLIIIKHNNDYLSAYAHNDDLLVSEKQWVKKGQKIATMGSTGTNNVRLHFEIRFKGKSVNPDRYLPEV